MQYGANKPSWHRSSTVANKSFAGIEAIHVGYMPRSNKLELMHSSGFPNG